MSRTVTQHLPLNLKLPADRIRIGKQFAHLHGTTVSALVSEVFGALERLEAEPTRLHPLLERLAGIVPDPGRTRQEVVMEALERKYGAGTEP
jgi:hypothetical protein